MSSDFPSTHWSVLGALAQSDPEAAREALAVICRVYWHPIYAAVRRRESSPDRALDLTQGFFVHLLEKGGLEKADRERGRFRTFLLTCLRNYLSHVREHEGARVRSPERPLVSIDGAEGENRYRLVPSGELTPEQVFERQWAYTVVSRAMRALEDRHRHRPGVIPVAHLRELLLEDERGISYREIAAQSGSSEAAVKMAVRRLRERFGRFVRLEVEPTVVDAAAVDEEVRLVLRLFGQSGMSLEPRAT